MEAPSPPVVVVACAAAGVAPSHALAATVAIVTTAESGAGVARMDVLVRSDAVSARNERAVRRLCVANGWTIRDEGRPALVFLRRTGAPSRAKAPRLGCYGMTGKL